MRKILSLVLVVGLMAIFSASVFADDDFVITRDKAALDVGRYQNLIKTAIEQADAVVLATITQPVYIYRIYVTSLAATSGMAIYDAGSIAEGINSNCVFEVYEATNGAGYYIDFGDDPIKLTTGFTITLFDAYTVVHYRGQIQD